MLLVAQTLLTWIQDSDRTGYLEEACQSEKTSLLGSARSESTRGLELWSGPWRCRVSSLAIDSWCTSLAGTEISPFYEEDERKELCKVIVLHAYLNDILFTCISVTCSYHYHRTQWKIHRGLCLWRAEVLDV